MAKYPIVRDPRGRFYLRGVEMGIRSLRNKRWQYDVRHMSDERVKTLAYAATDAVPRGWCKLCELYEADCEHKGSASSAPATPQAASPLCTTFPWYLTKRARDGEVPSRFGAPPPELSSVDEVLRYVQDNPGAMG